MVSKPESKIKPERVLFIRLSAIGDVLLVTPVFRIFHDHFPSTKIDFVIKEKFAPLISRHPLLHDLIIMPDRPVLRDLMHIRKIIRSRRYEYIFDLQKHWRSYFISCFSGAQEVHRYTKYAFRRFFLVSFKKNFYRGVPETIPMRYFQALKSLAIEWKKCTLELYLPREIEERVAREFPFPEQERVVAVAPGAGRATKRWPREHFVELMTFLRSRYAVKFLLLGGEEDTGDCDQIANAIPDGLVNWCGKTSILETAAALKQCDLLICNDTGLMHMATALHVKVVALFGPTVREFGFVPESENVAIVEHPDLRCRPCSFHGTASCPRGDFRCMKEISPAMVLDKMDKLFP